MSSCHLSLAKAEFYPQNFRVEAPEPLPEKIITPRRTGGILINAAAESSAALLGRTFTAPEEGAPPSPVERVLVSASFGLVPH